MDQYALSTLFKRFEKALEKLNRQMTIKLAVKDCMLVKVSDGVCEFLHVETGIRLRFDTRTDTFLK